MMAPRGARIVTRGLPVDQSLKLLGDLDVQLDDTLVCLALATILGSDREGTVTLGVVENREQLGAGIDHGALHGLTKTTERVICFTGTRPAAVGKTTPGRDSAACDGVVRRGHPFLSGHHGTTVQATTE
jgi:hypothetical protein